MFDQNLYNEDYYERGVELKKSGYQDYRWIAERVFPIATYLRKCYPNKSILDFGCAKGFLVHALRLLAVEAYGYDPSIYAISNCHPRVKAYVSIDFSLYYLYDIIIAKDVLEHICKEDMPQVLSTIKSHCTQAFFIFPLGDSGRYRIPDYHIDVGHLIAEDEEWWLTQFSNAGFKLIDFTYKIEGIKDNWTSKYPFGNAMVKLEC